MSARWVGFDLDGTLAVDADCKGPLLVGAPVPLMVAKLKEHVAAGVEVRIFTARVSSDGTPDRELDAARARYTVSKWCLKHIGREFPVTNAKDYSMRFFYDDRATQVVPNTGQTLRDVLKNLVEALDSSRWAQPEYRVAVAALEATK